MGTLRSDLKTLHCTDEVQCGDVITDTLWNKQAEATEGLYTLGWLACDAPHHWRQGKALPVAGYEKGNVTFPTTQGVHDIANIWHPAALHQGITHFSLVCEVNMLFTGFAAIPGGNWRFDVTSVEFFLEGYSATGPAPTQALLTIVNGTPGPGQVQVPTGQKKIVRATGAIPSTMLPGAGILWDGRLRVRVRGTMARLVTGSGWGFVAPSQPFPVADWWGVLYYQLRFHRVC